MRQRIENWLLRRLFNAIVLDDIISNDPKTGIVLIDGQPVKPVELSSIQAEIKALEGFRIWKIMSNTTKYLAEEKIFNKSVVFDDMRYGKSMLYNLSLQKSILEALKTKKLHS